MHKDTLKITQLEIANNRNFSLASRICALLDYAAIAAPEETHATNYNQIKSQLLNHLATIEGDIKELNECM